MNRAMIGAALLAASLAAANAHSAKDSLDAYYPEGPIVEDERVLFAEMHKDRIVAWGEDGASQTFYERPGCGPTAIASYGDGYAVLCHLTNEIQIVSKDGKPQKRLDKDTEGRGFVHPNDASADDAGGVYFSASGVFHPEAAAEGAVLYLDKDGIIHRLADRLHYANGVHFDARRELLFVSEHLGRRILSYPVLASGRLGRPAVFANFAAMKENFVRSDWPLSGPDGMETDRNGNLYAAYYGDGGLFIISPDGDIMRRIEAPAALITNVALTADGREIVVTASHRRSAKPYPGVVLKLPNPLFADD